MEQTNSNSQLSVSSSTLVGMQEPERKYWQCTQSGVSFITCKKSIVVSSTITKTQATNQSPTDFYEVSIKRESDRNGVNVMTQICQLKPAELNEFTGISALNDKNIIIKTNSVPQESNDKFSIKTEEVNAKNIMVQNNPQITRKAVICLTRIDQADTGAGGQSRQCKHCEETCIDREQLIVHEKLHEEKYLCDICGREFMLYGSLHRHLRRKTCVKQLSKATFSCKLCLVSFDDKGTFYNHMRSIHKKKKKFKCSTCGFCVSARYKLVIHVRKHTLEKPFECASCGRKFSDPYYKHIHERLHSGFRPYKCKVCGKRYISSGNLSEHVKTHSDAKPHECKVCGKAFSHTRPLRRHQESHSSVKKYKCVTCGKGFKRKQFLRRHLATHDDKSCQCDICGNMYKSSDYLKEHLIVHTDDKPFACDVCGKRFQKQIVFSRHQKTHTGIKPHECDICGKCFGQSGSLRRHMRVHTGEKPFECHICGMRFTQRSAMNSHVNRHGTLKSSEVA